MLDFVSWFIYLLGIDTDKSLGNSYEQVLEDIYEYDGSSGGPHGILQGGFALEMLRTRLVQAPRVWLLQLTNALKPICEAVFYRTAWSIRCRT